MRYLSGRNAHTQPVHGRFLLPLVHLQGERRAQRFKNQAWPHLSTPHCTCNPQRGAWRSPRRRPLTLVSCLSSRMSVWPPPLRIRCRSRATSSSSSPIGVSLVLRDLGGEQGRGSSLLPPFTPAGTPQSHASPQVQPHTPGAPCRAGYPLHQGSGIHFWTSGQHNYLTGSSHLHHPPF